MNATVKDLRPTIMPRSDQTNADQLLSGPVIITVTNVEVSNSKEQPVTIHYEGEGGRPYKPGLTMRKVLVLAWGHDAEQWRGRSMELFHEPSVMFGGELVGGIRISRMSHITKDIKVSLAKSKGKKALHEIGVLRQSDELVAALAAIAAATGRDSMSKARALAEGLKDANEQASAREAYRLKVSSLKEAAEKAKAPAAFDLAAFTARAAACPDEDALMALTEEVAAMADGRDKTAADDALKARFAELSGGAE